jgi:predicted O-methyltransferase YrrM
MSNQNAISFTRYLTAKRSVDDRALNRHVWKTLCAIMSSYDSPSILEIGSGIGTMIDRILAWNLLPKRGEYTAIDSSLENIAFAQTRLHEISPESIDVHLETIDVFDFIKQRQTTLGYDLLMAHAFLDLIDLTTSLGPILSLIRPGGHFYFTINFDGETILEPAIDPDYDALVIELYHRAMDAREVAGRRSGDRHTGRHLFRRLKAEGAQIKAAGSSDWTVFAGSGGYPADEAYFLHFIIHTIESAIKNHPEIDARRFANWIDKRHTQIEQKELIYIAHQLDFVGTLPQP